MKKIVSLLCILTLLLSTFAMMASAATTEPSKWDGVVPAAQPDYQFEGEGTEASPYLIKSAAEFAIFAANCRYNSVETTYSGKYFQLTVDIDMQNKEWWGIGGATPNNFGFPTTEEDIYRFSYFAGIFDGAGHKIYNFNLASTTEIEVEVKDEAGNVTGTEKKMVAVDKQGLFGWVVGATVKNIGIESGNVTLTNVARSGLLVGTSRHGFLIDNCYNKANLTVETNAKYAMIGMFMGASMDAWKNNHNTQQTAENVYQGKTISNSYNTGKLTVTMTNSSDGNEFRIGGIVGAYVGGAPEFVNVYNTGDIAITNSNAIRADGKGNARLGGLAGAFLDNCYAVKSYYTGTITFNATVDTARDYGNFGYLFGGVSGNFVTEPDADGNYSVSYKGTFTCNGTAVEAGIGKATYEWLKPSEAAITVPLAANSDFMIAIAEDKPVEQPTEEPTKAPETPTEKPTQAPETPTKAPEATTKAPEATNAPSTTEKKGCGSAIGIVSVIALTAIASGAALSLRKKED